MQFSVFIMRCMLKGNIRKPARKLFFFNAEGNANNIELAFPCGFSFIFYNGGFGSRSRKRAGATSALDKSLDVADMPVLLKHPFLKGGYFLLKTVFQPKIRFVRYPLKRAHQCSFVNVNMNSLMRMPAACMMLVCVMLV